MGERTQYTPGTFSWADLTTTDQDAAKSFYGELFGWEYTDNPVGDDAVYTMASIDGKDVAAISSQPQQQREAGVPPMWNSYITVQSADDAAAKAGELGATVHAPPFDVMDVGRMAVIADPQGAFFEIWEPKSHIGARLVNAPGALSWNELSSPDIDASVQFYSGLFGWRTNEMDFGGQKYVVVSVGERGNGGIRGPMTPQEPPNWLVYFGSADADATVAKASELGGNVLAPAMDLNDQMRIAVLQDPQGAVFALYAGHYED
jgi:predicted enzyme related to lactoylglutathione lyase